MTDTKELLQLAALAAGIEIDEFLPLNGGAWAYTKDSDVNSDGEHCIFKWQPHTNSGDSRDLQVKLKISLEWVEDFDGDRWDASIWNGDSWLHRAHTDPNMAVLIVASELGKAMKENE